MSLLDWFALIVISLTIIGVAVGRFPVFRMNRATIALVGSAILIASGWVSLEQAYRAIDFNTIVLLFSMMVLNINLRLAGFFRIVSSRIVLHTGTPQQLLLALTFASGLLSSLFLNDTIVIMFTPLVLEVVLALKRNPIPYLIALATAANVGSAATIVGNPQNMIIGIFSGIPFVRFAFYLAPVSILGLFLVWLVIRLLYKAEFRRENFQTPVKMEVKPFRPLLYKSLVAMGGMVVAFVAGAPIPVAALGAAAFLLFTRRIKPERVFTELDWSLLVFFSGLFIVTDALHSNLLGKFGGLSLPGASDAILVNLSLISLILSNLISNVPAVLLLSPLIKTMENPEILWLTLAMATTFAGNLTLLGSVANLIVAESARRQGVILKFGEYLKAGIPITILTIILGVGWLSLFG